MTLDGSMRKNLTHQMTDKHVFTYFIKEGREDQNYKVGLVLSF